MIAQAISQASPFLIEAIAEKFLVSGMTAEDALEKATELVHLAIDALQAQESRKERLQRARWITDAAVHVLHGWAGEPTVEAGKQAVDIVSAMFVHAEQLIKR